MVVEVVLICINTVDVDQNYLNRVLVCPSEAPLLIGLVLFHIILPFILESVFPFRVLDRCSSKSPNHRSL